MSELKDKKLTQVQKNYLVRRINEIANIKIRKLGGNPNYGASARHSYYYSSPTVSVNKHNLDRDSVTAITNGEVKLRNKSDIISELRDMLKAGNTMSTYINLSSLTFVDLKSLEAFNKAKANKKNAELKAKEKRVNAVRDTADKLKDSVMLAGSLAVELLEDFEKKEF